MEKSLRTHTFHLRLVRRKSSPKPKTFRFWGLFRIFPTRNRGLKASAVTLPDGSGESRNSPHPFRRPGAAGAEKRLRREFRPHSNRFGTEQFPHRPKRIRWDQTLRRWDLRDGNSMKRKAYGRSLEVNFDLKCVFQAQNMRLGQNLTIFQILPQRAFLSRSAE